ncbi:hypothetical protein HD554DRAFT_1603499 [Boletus coccyginus]|nr:hypothetical protein HD554DRAFT_1603499 [Boletus coccyginus]
MSFPSMSRGDYDQSEDLNVVAVGRVDSEEDQDRLLPGDDDDGLGVGLAGGYPGSQSPPPAPAPTATATAAAAADVHPNTPNPYPAPAPVPAPALAGAGDDLYAGYDPGMAGCTAEQGTCHIPGVPHVGAEHALAHHHHHAPGDAHGHARGYERDADEYAEGTSESPSRPSSPALDTAASPGDPNTNPGGSTTRPERRPSVGTRLVGRVERLAGKVLRDPHIEARGKRHMTSV